MDPFSSFYRSRLVVLHYIKLKKNWVKEVLVRCMWVDEWVPQV